MTLEEYLNENSLTFLYEKTQNMFPNFWDVVSNNEAYFQFIQIDLMELLNPIHNLNDKLEILAPIPQVAQKMQAFPNVTYAFLTSDQPSDIFKFHQLLPIFNGVNINILKIALLPEEFLTKLDDSFAQKRIQESHIAKLMDNVYISSSNTLCVKFINFLMKLSEFEFARNIIIFTENDGTLLAILEKNFEKPEDYYLRLTDHYSIGVDLKEHSEFLLNAFYAKEWKQTVIENFFNAFNPDILETIDKLKTIEFLHPYHESILLGLLNIMYIDPLNGYKRVTLLLSWFVDGKKFSPFLNVLKYFSQNEVNAIFLKLSQVASVPTNFLALTDESSVSILKNLSDAKENLFWQLENSNAFHHFFNAAGNLYTDLLNEMKNGNVDNISTWLKILNKNTNVLDALQTLSKTENNEKGFPNLISGILSIGEFEDPSILPSEARVQEFLNAIFIDINGTKITKNIAQAIETLDSKIKAKKVVALIKDKAKLIDNLSFHDDEDFGLEKAKNVLHFLVPTDSKVMKKVAKHFFNAEDAKEMINQLFYKDEKGNFQITSGFLKAIEQNSNAENVMKDIQSFSSKIGGDQFKFVRLLEQIGGSDTAFAKFDNWLKDSLQSRETLINKMNSIGTDQLSTFVTNFLGESGMGDLFSSLNDIKGKSSKLYDGLMTVFSKIPAGQFEELHPLIEQRVSAITKNADDVMSALNSAEINYDKAKLFLTSLSPDLIEAIHNAFEGDDDAEQTLKIITCLLDKDFIIEALNRLSIVEATLLLRAFSKNNTFMQKALYTINNFGYEGKFIRIILLFKEMLMGDNIPQRQRQGVSPIPIKVCDNFLAIAGDMTDSTLWENLSQRGLIYAFEKVLTSSQNQKIARALLKDKPFMFVLSCINNKEALIQYLCDLHKTEDHIYLSEIYATHFVLFDKLGILVSNDLFPVLDQDETLRSNLNQLVDVALDPSAKLLACTIYTMYDKGYQTIEAFVNILAQNPGMKEALCRLFNWKKNTIQEIFILIDWINKRFIKGKDKFKFPSHQNIVIQDDYLYQWLERAKTTL